MSAIQALASIEVLIWKTYLTSRYHQHRTIFDQEKDFEVKQPIGKALALAPAMAP
jgi:hypothetical protein